MECSAIEPARSSESGLSTSILPRLHGTFDVVHLTGLSATLPQDIVFVKEFWTPQALATKRRKAVSALDIRKYEATLRGTSKNKLSAEFTRMYSTPASSTRRLTPHKPREPTWTQTSDNRYHYTNKLHDEMGKHCERAVGSIKMNSICWSNLLLRISICYKDLASVGVDHMRSSTCRLAVRMLVLFRYRCESTSASALLWF